MILDKEVEVTINSSNYNRLRDLGYSFIRTGDKVLIDVKHLSSGSHVKITVKCFFCGEEKKVDYCNYLSQIKKGNNKYYCSLCNIEKTKKTLLKEFNVDNISKLDFIKQKKIDTTYKNYGVDHTFQSDINKEKRVNSMFEKYGVFHNSQLDSYKKMRMKDALEYNLEYRKYRNHVRRVTKISKIKLFENWNGYDYYDNEYIKENLNLNWFDGLYPSVDHKNSVIYGYINNITPEILGDIDNLCITKRCINSSKNKKIENEFIYNKI